MQSTRLSGARVAATTLSILLYCSKLSSSHRHLLPRPTHVADPPIEPFRAFLEHRKDEHRLRCWILRSSPEPCPAKFVCVKGLFRRPHRPSAQRQHHQRAHGRRAPGLHPRHGSLQGAVLPVRQTRLGRYRQGRAVERMSVNALFESRLFLSFLRLTHVCLPAVHCFA